MYSVTSHLLGILCLRNDTVLGGDLEKNVGLPKNLPALVHLSPGDFWCLQNTLLKMASRITTYNIKECFCVSSPCSLEWLETRKKIMPSSLKNITLAVQNLLSLSMHCWGQTKQIFMPTEAAIHFYEAADKVRVSESQMLPPAKAHCRTTKLF